MHMQNNSEFIDMMSGGFGQFTQYELWYILLYQHEFHINNLKIQKLSDGKFICLVDKKTVENYLREHPCSK